MNKRVKLFLKIFVVLYLLYLFNNLSSDSMTPETHYIPDGFTGVVQIYMEFKDGEPKEFIGKRRVYRIGEDGTLKTQFKSNTGWIKDSSLIEYYYVDSIGNPIRKLRNFMFTRKDSSLLNEIGGYYFGYSTVGNMEYLNGVVTLSYKIDTLKKLRVESIDLVNDIFPPRD